MDTVAQSFDKTRIDLARAGTIVRTCAIAGIGYIACQYHSTYVLAALMVIAWGIARSRKQAYFAILLYSLFSTWVVVPAIVDYLSWHPVKAVAFWLIALIMSSAPWLLLYRKDCRFLEGRLALLLAVTWIPPIGFVQFASPFVGTSLLISGFGWVSVASGVLVTGLIVRGIHRGYYRCSSLAALALITVGLFGRAESIPGWVDVNTQVKVGGISHTIEGSLDALQQVKRVALSKEPRVAVLGESTGGYSLDVGKSILRRVSEKTIVLAGGRVDEKQALFMWGRDSAENIYNQRVRPILLEHMDGTIHGNRTAEVDGLNIAPLICYEGSVPYPLASAMQHSPEAIVSLANFHWSRNDKYFERVLRAHISAWGRIFSIPTIVAVNRRGISNV